MSSDIIFRKYDIRGKVGVDFKVEDGSNIAKAIAFFLKQKKQSCKTIAVGMDGRVHSQALKEEICKGLLDSGMDVIFIGLCPTPGLYFATNYLPVDAGLMITASHNPMQDNGIKITLDRQSVWDDQIKVIRDLFKAGTKITTTQKGTYQEFPIIEKYVEYLSNSFPNLHNFKTNSIIDCGNGTAGSVLPQLIKKMNLLKTDLLFEKIDGNFPNHEPDPTVEKNLEQLKDEIKNNNKISLSIALDGDCDRVATMTKSGKLVSGDVLLGIFSQFLDKSKTDNKIAVAFDIKCSTGLIELLEKNNIKPCVAPTGFAYVKEAMKQNNALFGGELSGHYCFKDRYFGYDDGIYAMLRLFEILQISDKSLEELIETFPKRVSSKEFRIECSEEKKINIINCAKQILSSNPETQILEIDGIRASMKYGCGILRASNTQPVLSMRFESSNEKDLMRVKEDFFNAISQHFDINWLKKQLDL